MTLVRAQTSAKTAYIPLSTVVVIYGVGRKVLTIAASRNGNNSTRHSWSGSWPDQLASSLADKSWPSCRSSYVTLTGPHWKSIRYGTMCFSFVKHIVSYRAQTRRIPRWQRTFGYQLFLEHSSLHVCHWTLLLLSRSIWNVDTRRSWSNYWDLSVLSSER